MKSGAIGMCLDPAAPLAGYLPTRDEVSYFAAHPSHPSVFNWEADERAHYDYFGGIAAKQTIVCALIQGKEEDYARGEAMAKTIYSPVTTSYRITIEQMGILEPALSDENKLVQKIRLIVKNKIKCLIRGFIVFSEGF